MNFIIVGMGSIGNRHFKNIVDIGHKCVGIETEAGFDAEVPNCDAIIICTPTHLHEHYIKKALKLKKPVYVEKPVGTKSNNFNNTDFGNIPFMVGYNLRFHPQISSAKKLKKEGGFGKIYKVQIVCNTHLPSWRKNDYKTYYSSSKKEGGGVILDISHEIDYATWIFGQPSKIIASYGNSSNLNIDAEDFADIIFEMEEGYNINIHLDYFSKKQERYMEVTSEKGTFRFTIELDDRTILNETYNSSINNFIYAVERFKEQKSFDLSPNLKEGIEVLKICEEIKWVGDKK